MSSVSFYHALIIVSYASLSQPHSSCYLDTECHTLGTSEPHIQQMHSMFCIFVFVDGEIR